MWSVLLLLSQADLLYKIGLVAFNTVPMQTGVEDQYQHGRGVALADFNGDGKTDIVYGNWNGPHRLFLQRSDSSFQVREEWQNWQKQKVLIKCILREVQFSLQNIATGRFAEASPIRTVIAADFDNDKELEVFFNNIAYRGNAPNRLFRLDFMYLLNFQWNVFVN